MKGVAGVKTIFPWVVSCKGNPLISSARSTCLDRTGRAFERLTGCLQDFEQLRPWKWCKVCAPRRLKNALRVIECATVSGSEFRIDTRLGRAAVHSPGGARQSSPRTDYSCLAARILRWIFSISRTVDGTISALRCFATAAFLWGISREKSVF